MPHSRVPEAARVIRETRDTIATSRHLIAQAARESEQMRATIAETRRLIQAARANLVEGGV